MKPKVGREDMMLGLSTNTIRCVARCLQVVVFVDLETVSNQGKRDESVNLYVKLFVTD